MKVSSQADYSVEEAIQKFGWISNAKFEVGCGTSGGE